MMDNPFLEMEDSRTRGAPGEQPSFATVTAYSGGKAKIRIDGEAQERNTQYRCIESCVPNVGDRVFFMRVSGTILIIGVI